MFDTQSANFDVQGLSVALIQAELGRREGGIPIGSALISPLDPDVGTEEVPASGRIYIHGHGRNQRLQKSSAILHAEMDALEKAGRLAPEVYKKATMFTTLRFASYVHKCMCTGAILLYGIPRVVIGENTNFKGEEDLLRSRGVEVVVLDNQRCKELMREFIRYHPEEWDEDVGGSKETSARAS
ncbi:hypothetical protein EUX98_g7902 [Antrodiella citrinella]|uniref:CMP/dCMP-type deaminase domain-containing protein n=1 Tax=Antrodiella citrinella TaxID=2447956 RepID=A0A4V3XGZ1_9APHY|nr:hypothetical protein EUX98_g7902 [Antrodiella citrinella]